MFFMQEIKERIHDLRTVYPEKSVSYLNESLECLNNPIKVLKRNTYILMGFEIFIISNDGS